VAAFTTDAITLTTGEEIKIGGRVNIFATLRERFAAWKKIIEDHGIQCECIKNLVLTPSVGCGFRTIFHTFVPIAVNLNIEKEVSEYERRYRGRELPGFINYKTFEDMVKEQIRQLEGPAILTLKEVAGMSWVGDRKPGPICYR